MNESEARMLVEQINESVGSVRDKLLRLRDDGGWQALGYDSWRTCAAKEFKIGTARVYQLVNAAEVQKSLPEAKINERVAREIAKLPEPDRPKAYAKAVEKSEGKPPTAKEVKAVVREMLPNDDDEKPIKKVPRGEIKSSIQKAIEGAEEFRAIIRDLQAIGREIVALGEKDYGCHINQQACKADLNNVWRHLRFAAPHAPCPYCGQKGCRACRKLGWVPLSAWKNAPKDLTKGHE